MIKMRTKIEIVGVIFLALSISLASVFAVTRTITVENSTISFNILVNTNAEGIQEDSDCAYNIFVGNNAE